MSPRRAQNSRARRVFPAPSGTHDRGEAHPTIEHAFQRVDLGVTSKEKLGAARHAICITRPRPQNYSCPSPSGYAARVEPLIRTVDKHHRVVVILSLLLTIVATFIVATRWNIDSDFKALLPQDSPAAQAMTEVGDRIGSGSALFVVIDSPDKQANIAFAGSTRPSCASSMK